MTTASWQWPQATLVLAATPIGNMGDATGRLRDALGQADIIAAEDTRNAATLIDLLGVETHATIISCFDHNEQQRARQIADAIIDDDARVLFISDAGMPSVSDPGFRLTSHAIERGIDVTVLPGPSAVPTALALSGLETDRFTFEGFPARKPSHLRRQLQQLRDEPRTMVFFESPRRVHATLTMMAQVFGSDRRAALCREMTKMYEQVIRGTLADLVAATKQPPRGEIVLVIAGCPEQQQSVDVPTAARRARAIADNEGVRLKSACKRVADATGVPASDIYSVAVTVGSADT